MCCFWCIADKMRVFTFFVTRWSLVFFFIYCLLFSFFSAVAIFKDNTATCVVHQNNVDFVYMADLRTLVTRINVIPRKRFVIYSIFVCRIILWQWIFSSKFHLLNIQRRAHKSSYRPAIAILSLSPRRLTVCINKL